MKNKFSFLFFILYSCFGFSQSDKSIEETITKFRNSEKNNDYENTIKYGEIIVNNTNFQNIEDSLYNKILETTIIANWNNGKIERVYELAILYTKHSTKLFGNNSLEVGKGWQYQGISLASMLKYDRAIYNLKKALYIYSNIQSDDPEYIKDFILQTKKSIGNILEKQQKYDEALDIFNDLQFQYENIINDSLELLKIYNYQVKINNELSNFNTALYFAEQALKYSKNLFSKGYEEIIIANNNLGQVHYSLGNYNNALLHNKITLDLIEQYLVKDSLKYAASLANSASLYYQIGQNDEAFRLDSLSSSVLLRIASSHSYEFIKSCLKMGSLYPKNGDFNIPIQYLNLGLDKIREVFDKGSQFEIKFLIELALWQNLNKNQNQAIRNAKLSIKYAKKLYKKDPKSRTFYYEILSAYGKILIDNGKSKVGLEYKFQSLYYFAINLGIRSSLYLNEFDQIKSVAVKLGDHKYLREYWGKVIETKFLNFFEKSIGLSEYEKLKYKLSIKEDLDNYLSYLIKFNVDSLYQSAYNIYLNVTNFVSDDKRYILNLARNSNEIEIRKNYDEWVLYKSKLNFINEERNINHLNQTLKLKDLIAKTEQKLSWNYSRKTDFKSLITYTDVSNKLAKDELFIDFTKISSSQYIIFFTKSSNKIVDYLIINHGSEFENEILSYYTSSTNRIVKLSELNDEISNNNFWKPIADKIGDAKTIYVSLGGIYNNINLNTIYNPTTGKYLIEEKDIRIVNSARDFVLSKESEKKKYTTNTASLFGFPNFDGNTTISVDTTDIFASSRNLNSFWLDSLTRGGMKAKPLPATKTEVENISTTLKSKDWKVNSFLSDDASETNIKKQQSPRILHIATHGYFFENIPMVKDENRFLGMDRQQVVQDPMLRSGLLLTGANKTLKGETKTGENGLLSAAEASLLDLRETELVVLSACETGKGEVKNSEGVYGLRKAFSDAGAQNIIMSLWKVDDKVTQEFMSRFYEIWLNEKTNIREAFNKSQLEIKAKYPQPYYWGAFILVGE